MSGVPAAVDRPGLAASGDQTALHAAAAAPQSTLLAWAVLAMLWAVQVPLFLAMPITNDAAVYDIQARQVWEGGVLYRDIFEPNLPGVVWMHLLVRLSLGWSSEALRCFDLILFSGILLLAAGHLHRLGASPKLTLWGVVALSAFYFASSEWIHCQRDTWMLLPSLGALELRARQAARLRRSPRAGSVFGWGLVEGLVWGLAVWIKPHIVLPAATAWVIVAFDRRSWRMLAVDACGLLLGGLAIGALGVGWLVASGSWPHFTATLRDWNPRYVKAGKEHWTLARFVGMNVRMFPWPLVHLAALMGAALVARNWLRRRKQARPTTVEPGKESDDGDRWLRGLLVVGFYVAWTFQAFFIQHLFDYVHAPPILLGMVTVAVTLAITRRTVWKYVAVAALVLAILVSPLLRSDRLGGWTAAVRQGSTPELRDRLRRLATPEWQHLEQVAEYLESQHVKSGEVLSINDAGVHFYTRLGIRPPTRFCYIEQSYFLFPEYRPNLRQLIQQTPHRFVVVNLVESGFSRDDSRAVADDNPLSAPPLLNTKLNGAYPWSLPIVYRSGPYLVFRVEGVKGKLLLPAPRRS